MNCKTTVELLSAYLDRELAPLERDAVRAHLADCDRCRTEERDLRALKGLLLGVRAPEPAEDFERRLMSRLREETSRPVRTLRLPTLRPLAMGQLAGLAMAAALAGVVLMSTGHTDPRPQVVIERPRETVAKNVDLDVYAQRDEAYARAGDSSSGAPLLMPTSYGP